MLSDYIPVLLQFIVATGLAAAILVLSMVLGKSSRGNKIKDTAYECGMLPVGDGQPRFSVKFYLVAMLFVIFDIEVVFLYPWAVNFREMMEAGNSAMILSMGGFVTILLVGYIYALKKGAFQWKD